MDDSYTEQEQWERAKAWIRENGLWLLAGVALGVGGLVGWNWWQERIETRAREASRQYEQLLEAFDRGDRTRAMTLVEQLRTDYGSSPYADQADLAAARAHVEASELPQAAERLARIMNGSKDQELRLIARMRLARVQLAQGNPDVALATLTAAGDTGAFAPRFQELRGDVLFAKDDKAGALREYRGARAADAGGVLDTVSLELKIADLLADGLSVDAAAAAGATPQSAPEVAR